MTLIQKNELDIEDEKKKAEDSESKKDVAYLLLAVLGTLFFISAIMVNIPCICSILSNTFQIGAAWLAGARFDVAINELKKGVFFPTHTAGSEAAASIVQTHDHVEL